MNDEIMYRLIKTLEFLEKYINIAIECCKTKNKDCFIEINNSIQTCIKKIDELYLLMPYMSKFEDVSIECLRLVLLYNSYYEAYVNMFIHNDTDVYYFSLKRLEKMNYKISIIRRYIYRIINSDL